MTASVTVHPTRPQGAGAAGTGLALAGSADWVSISWLSNPLYKLAVIQCSLAQPHRMRKKKIFFLTVFFTLLSDTAVVLRMLTFELRRCTTILVKF